MLELYERLFNHRPFVQGEVRSFVKEFEEKRGDREVENVFKVLERVTELRVYEVDHLKAQCESAMPGLAEKLEATSSVCERILSRAQNSEIEQAFEASKASRDKEWRHFVSEASVQHEKVDEAYQLKEDDLKRHYALLETKLQEETQETL